jgi:putative ABC transport system substrate-binding protein
VNRRSLIMLFGGAAAWPLAASAQSKLPIIGFLGPASASVMGAWTAAFAQRLREFGWIEGRNITIEYRWAEGRADRVVELAAELVQLNASVVVTTGTGVPPLKQAT